MDYEYKIDVAGVEYADDAIVAGALHHPLFEKFGAGNACAASMSVSFYPSEEPPRMAPITVFSRAVGAEAWAQIGKFYTDTRSSETLTGGRILTLNAYDAMLKAEQVFLTEGNVEEWPKTMPVVVAAICERMGVELDPRTVINPDYVVNYPGDYTMREILRHIAAAHAGNWMITRDEKLLLVPLFSAIPAEVAVLGTEDGNPISFGGVVLLV